MRNIIREKRKVTFGYLRITPQIIRQLATIIDEEVQEEINNNNYCFYLYSVDANDDSSFESQSISIFDAHELIDKKVIYKINMRFNLFDNSKNIEVQLKHLQEDENKENYIMISGDEPNWVNGVSTRMQEILDHAEPQPRYNTFIGWAVFSTCVLFFTFYIKLAHPIIKKWHDDASSWATIIIFLLIIFSGGYLNNYLQSMFPMIELQTGFNHFQLPLQKRKKLSLITFSIIVPLLLAIVYDVLKSWID